MTEGDAVSLPCVGSSGAAPSFSLAGEALPTNLSGPYSLDFPSVSFSDAGNYTCQVGEATAIVTVNVDVMLGECEFASIPYVINKSEPVIIGLILA